MSIVNPLNEEIQLNENEELTDILSDIDSPKEAAEEIQATAEESLLHEAWLDELDSKTDGKCLWRMETSE